MMERIICDFSFSLAILFFVFVFVDGRVIPPRLRMIEMMVEWWTGFLSVSINN